MEKKQSKSQYKQGRYIVKIIGAVLGESTKGTPRIELIIEPVSYFENNTTTNVAGPTRIVFLPLTDITMGSSDHVGWVADMLADLGFIGPSFSDLEPLVGKVRDGEMRITEHDNAEVESWTIYKQRSSFKPVKPLESGKLSELDAKYADVINKARRSKRNN